MRCVLKKEPLMAIDERITAAYAWGRE